LSPRPLSRHFPRRVCRRDPYRAIFLDGFVAASANRAIFLDGFVAASAHRAIFFEGFVAASAHRADPAGANVNSANVSVLLNLGNGTFAAAVNYAAGSGPYSVTAADLNGDGKPDLAVANSGGNVSVLLNTCLP
jgi:hypothetical protein